MCVGNSKPKKRRSEGGGRVMTIVSKNTPAPATGDYAMTFLHCTECNTAIYDNICNNICKKIMTDFVIFRGISILTRGGVSVSFFFLFLPTNQQNEDSTAVCCVLRSRGAWHHKARDLHPCALLSLLVKGASSLLFAMNASHASPRYQSHPDDVFHADIRRPKDRAQNVLRHNQSSSEEEAHRKLCGAVIDGQADVLRSLLVVGGLDANVRNNRGDTAGHQVRPSLLKAPYRVFL